MVDTFLPATRQLVARELRSQGFSQSAISNLLGITQASVSLYLSSSPERSYSSFSSFSVGKAEALRYSARLAEAVKRNATDGVNTLNSIWTGLLGSGSVCGAHRSMYPSLADCDVCIKEYGHRKDGRSEAISEVADAVKLLEASKTFVSVMPEVSVNIACAAGPAATPADVIAIPGRIVRVKGRARAMLPPEAGASLHMSRVLLLVRRRKPELRACINLRFDEKMAKTLRKLGLKSLTIGGYSFPGADDSTSEALEVRLKEPARGFDVIVDSGGSGIEPNVYLFAKGAREVAELALKASKVYSAL